MNLAMLLAKPPSHKRACSGGPHCSCSVLRHSFSQRFRTGRALERVQIPRARHGTLVEAGVRAAVVATTRPSESALSIGLAFGARSALNGLFLLVRLHGSDSGASMAALCRSNDFGKGVAIFQIRWVLLPSGPSIAELLSDNKAPRFGLENDIRAAAEAGLLSLPCYDILRHFDQLFLGIDRRPPAVDLLLSGCTDRKHRTNSLYAVLSCRSHF
mmetsp:Transcript_84939/g.182066  ORF Transcript_84939/g.182066 Transcript_84939/m.182066 type:complete len:214 (-) Transcript_84939:104-745(-)